MRGQQLLVLTAWLKLQKNVGIAVEHEGDEGLVEGEGGAGGQSEQAGVDGEPDGQLDEVQGGPGDEALPRHSPYRAHLAQQTPSSS